MTRIGDYTILAYYPASHEKAGQLAMTTTHVGSTARDIEIAVHKSRMRRGEIGFIEITDRRTPGVVQIITAADVKK